MYAVDHIRRVLTTFPGVFTGIGEFSIHKEFVSAKIAGETASLTNPALDRILDFAAEAGLVVILHNDIDMPFGKVDTEPVYLTQMKDAAEAAPEDHDHLGPHRPRADRPSGAGLGGGRRAHADAPRRSSRACSTTRRCGHVAFDISWDEVAKYAVSSPEVDRAGGGPPQPVLRPVPLRHRHRGAVRPDAVLRGLRSCGRRSGRRLTPEASRRIRTGNYERIFDEGRRRVRAWEAANVK